MTAQTPVRYRVVETACYPRSWKTEAIGFVDDNSWKNYFVTDKAAVAEVSLRGGVVTSVVHLKRQPDRLEV